MASLRTLSLGLLSCRQRMWTPNGTMLTVGASVFITPRKVPWYIQSWCQAEYNGRSHVWIAHGTATRLESEFFKAPPIRICTTYTYELFMAPHCTLNHSIWSHHQRMWMPLQWEITEGGHFFLQRTKMSTNDVVSWDDAVRRFANVHAIFTVTVDAECLKPSA